MIYAKKAQKFSILENLKKGYKFEKNPKKWKNKLQMAQIMHIWANLHSKQAFSMIGSLFLPKINEKDQKALLIFCSFLILNVTLKLWVAYRCWFCVKCFFLSFFLEERQKTFPKGLPSQKNEKQQVLGLKKVSLDTYPRILVDT